jgi:cell division protein FtsI (penicillin-binding protein 3)
VVVVHKPNKRIGYYGATVAAPVFKEIAQKIYASTPRLEMFKKENIAFESDAPVYLDDIDRAQKSFSAMPNVRGMPVMDALALLENMGLQVVFQGDGSGLVVGQSIRKGANIAIGDKVVIRI